MLYRSHGGESPLAGAAVPKEPSGRRNSIVLGETTARETKNFLKERYHYANISSSNVTYTENEVTLGKTSYGHWVDVSLGDPLLGRTTASGMTYKHKNSVYVLEMQCFEKYGLHRGTQILIQLNLFTMATLGTEESGRCREVAIVKRWSLVKVRLSYRARRNSSDEKKNIELPRHATIAILDATLFLRDFHLFVDEIHLTLKKKIYKNAKPDDEIFDKRPERVVSERLRHSDPNSPPTNVNKNVAFALLQKHPSQSY